MKGNSIKSKIFLYTFIISFFLISTDLCVFAFQLPYSKNNMLLYRTNATKITILSTTPGNMEYNAPSDVTIAVKFSEPINKGINFSRITLKDNLGNLVATSVVISNDTLFIYHTSTLEYLKNYTVTIPEGAVKGFSDSYINDDYSFWFTTQSDRTPPYIIETDPKSSADNVDVDTIITITYDEKIKEALSFKNIELVDNDYETVPIDVFIDDDTITIKPRKRLNFNTYYHYTIPAEAVADIAGNKPASSITYSFKTEEEKEPPVVEYTIPGTGTMYVPVDSNIMIGFNKNIQVVDTTGTKAVVKLTSGGKEVPVDTYISGCIIYARPWKNLNLSYNTTYNVQVISGSIKDTRGNVFKSSYSFTFTTQPEVGIPRIIRTKPEYGSSDAMPDSIITMNFNEAIQYGDTFKNITLKDAKGNSIPFTPLIGEDAIGLKPVNSLEYDTEYYFEIPKGAVKNSSGEALKYDYKYKFKTGVEKYPPVISATNPLNGANNVPTNAVIGIAFKEKIQKGDNYDYITLRDSRGNNVPILMDIKGNMLAIKLDGNVAMAYNTTYTVKIPYGAVKDLAGNLFSDSYTFSFTTGFDKSLLNVISCSPAENEKEVPVNSAIYIDFSDYVFKGDYFDSIDIKDSKGSIIASDISIDNNRLIIKPSKGLKYGSSYVVEIPYWSLTDSRGSAFLGAASLKFTTESKKNALNVKLTSPQSGIRDFDSADPIVITFDRDVVKSRDYNQIELKDSKGNNISISTTYIGNTLTVKPTGKLTPETGYNLFIPYSSVNDSSGKPMADDYKLSFTTKSDKDTVTEKAINFVKGYQYIVVTFSDNLQQGKNFKSITIKDARGNAVKCVTGIVRNMFVVKLNTPAKANSKYYVTIPPQALSDLKGNALNTGYSLQVQANEKSLWKNQ